MTTLRITHRAVGEDRHEVDLELAADGPRQSATAAFSLALTDAEQEKLRWYLEDYLSHPQDPAPVLAAEVEQRLTTVGLVLFKDLFHGNDDARDVWALVRRALADVRVEVVSGVREAATIPWELVRESAAAGPLALRARAFVRAHTRPAQPLRPVVTREGPTRILLVIARPSGGDDVPFRSVAVRIQRALDTGRAFQLDVLRPPTYERLAEVVRAAERAGAPYDVLHFDGHGTFLDLAAAFAGGADGAAYRALLASLGERGPARFSPRALYPHAPREQGRGYLVFENPDGPRNTRLVDGEELGKLLYEGRIPVLVLNACRSAHGDGDDEKPTPERTPGPADPHAQVRAFGTLAQEVMEQGLHGVVAMRYNVYVVTAAEFVASLYTALAGGASLGEAVNVGRRKLLDDPLRDVGFGACTLQDWCVPIVYEAAPVAPFHRRDAAVASPPTDRFGRLPRQPDVGFVGRDEALLALDRAFDRERIVLLHAWAGSGKTCTAAEFARWYGETGGFPGPALFTTFAQKRTAAELIDHVATAFGLEAKVAWLAMKVEERRALALQVVRQAGLFWVWDNVEPVGGFPAGAPSQWTPEERAELADLLRDLAEAGARVLLTSRRDEQGWLGDLPARVEMRPMPMAERLVLARALASKRGRSVEAATWEPLLKFTQGNPLTITVLVGQALRSGYLAAPAIAAFVDTLRAGTAAFRDEASEGRSRSLGASLAYGFENAFTEQERARIAVLALFQGFVDVDALTLMGAPESEWCVEELRGMTRAEGIQLLDRAAEVGVLTAQGNGYYSVHPAVPWFLHDLFVARFSEREEGVERAWVEAMGDLANFYHARYGEGQRGAIDFLAAEEANLLRSRSLARERGWWRRVISAMQGLDQLYDHRGRRAEWARLVEELVPDLVAREMEGPLPGREEEWAILTGYRVRLARQARDWAVSARLQRAEIAWRRERVAAFHDQPVAELTAVGRLALGNLAGSLHALGQVLREEGDPACLAAYEEALGLSERIGDRAGEATCAFNLGFARTSVLAIRDLEAAEHWFRRSLEVRGEDDAHGRGRCHLSLGAVAFVRFQAGVAAGSPREILSAHLSASFGSYQWALALLPPDAIADRAIAHGGLASALANAGQIDAARPHFAEAIRLREAMGERHAAGQTRYNFAVNLTIANRLPEARAYAQAALADFRTFGDRAAADIAKTEALLAQLASAS